MKAMIFAAGHGLRLRPITNTKPKALVEINGIPLLEIIIRKLIFYGFNDLIINIHYRAEMIIDFLKKKKNFDISINISDESDLLLDTGGGLKKASYFFNDGKPFIIHNVDVISDIDLEMLYREHSQNNALATLACMERNSTRQFIANSNDELCGWRNNQTGEVKMCREPGKNLKQVSFCGIQVINPELLGMIKEIGVFSIIDLYLRIASKYVIKLKPFNNAKWLDIGTPENLEKASPLLKEMEI